MKALILNSGKGTRMGKLTSGQPKCMTELPPIQTILSRQLAQLQAYGIDHIIMTTGMFGDRLVDYCQSLNFPLQYTFVENPKYENTNYIYSIYCARNHLMDDDIILLHGDLVFENEVLEQRLKGRQGCMVVSTSCALPQKDFKAVVKNGCIKAIGSRTHCMERLGDWQQD